MPTFNSVAELEQYVIERMRPATAAVEEKVYKIIQDYLRIYYGEYVPVSSIRTYSLFNSLVKTEVRRAGNGWEADVYFDVSKLNHLDQYIGKDGRIVRKQWSEEQILSTALTSGTHGGSWTRTSGTAIWNESMADTLPNKRQWWMKELRAAGIPVK